MCPKPTHMARKMMSSILLLALARASEIKLTLLPAPEDAQLPTDIMSYAVRLYTDRSWKANYLEVPIKSTHEMISVDEAVANAQDKAARENKRKCGRETCGVGFDFWQETKPSDVYIYWIAHALPEGVAVTLTSEYKKNYKPRITAAIDMEGVGNTIELIGTGDVVGVDATKLNWNFIWFSAAEFKFVHWRYINPDFGVVELYEKKKLVQVSRRVSPVLAQFPREDDNRVLDGFRAWSLSLHGELGMAVGGSVDQVQSAPRNPSPLLCTVQKAG